jgi:hypothetical protein
MAELKTLGISPKAILAFLFPLVASVVAALVNWTVTGHFDTDSVRLTLGGLGTSALAALGAYLGKPGIVVAPKQSSVLPLNVLAQAGIPVASGTADAVSLDFTKTDQGNQPVDIPPAANDPAPATPLPVSPAPSVPPVAVPPTT